MDFIKKSADKKPIVDTVFAIVEKAKEAKEKVGDQVVDATIGSLYGEDGKIVAYDTVFKNYDAIPASKKAAYANSFRGNPDFRELVKEWVLKDVKLESSVIATPGGTGAVSLVMSEFLEVGDTVIIPEIAWGSYVLMAKDKQLNLIKYEMFEENHFNLTSFKEQVYSLMGKQDRIVVVINDPCHNPTGYSMTLQEWEEVVNFLNEVSQTTPCIILNDIAYIDYAYDVVHSRDYLKVIEKMNERVMLVIAMSCSKTMTSYGLRCGAAVICAHSQESVHQAEIVFEKSARSLWSNVNNAAMINFVKVARDDVKAFLEEKNEYIQLLKERSRIFIEEANACGLPIYPYKEGFFVTVKIENENKDKYHEKLMENHIFTVQVNKGIRVAICSLSVEKTKGLAIRMKEILDEVVK